MFTEHQQLIDDITSDVLPEQLVNSVAVNFLYEARQLLRSGQPVDIEMWRQCLEQEMQMLASKLEQDPDIAQDPIFNIHRATLDASWDILAHIMNSQTATS